MGVKVFNPEGAKKAYTKIVPNFGNKMSYISKNLSFEKKRGPSHFHDYFRFLYEVYPNISYFYIHISIPNVSRKHIQMLNRFSIQKFCMKLVINLPI